MMDDKGSLLTVRSPASVDSALWPAINLDDGGPTLRCDGDETVLGWGNASSFMDEGSIVLRYLFFRISDHRIAFLVRDIAPRGGSTLKQLQASRQRTADAREGRALVGHIRWSELVRISAGASFKKHWSGSLSLGLRSADRRPSEQSIMLFMEFPNEVACVEWGLMLARHSLYWRLTHQDMDTATRTRWTSDYEMLTAEQDPMAYAGQSTFGKKQRESVHFAYEFDDPAAQQPQ